MGDERLRELERRWKEAGTVETEALYLLERVRAGELAKRRLELAAYCGHEAACRACGAESPARPEDLGDWVSDLGLWGTEVSVRAALALARLGSPLWERPDTAPLLLELIAAAEAWVDQPGDPTRTAAGELARRHSDLPFTPSLGATSPATLAAASAALATVQEVQGADSPGSAIHAPVAAENLAQALGEDTVRSALSARLGAWALDL